MRVLSILWVALSANTFWRLVEGKKLKITIELVRIRDRGRNSDNKITP